MAADWNSKRVECDSNPCKGSDGAILVSVVAIDRVVGPEEARAHVELLAIKDLERERGDHREGEEAQAEQVGQRTK